MDRRRFLHMLGLFSGATLLSSCSTEEGQKKLISQLVPPEDGVVPGEAVWHLSTCTECPAGCGLQVRVRNGWPVKLEGIPGHPVGGGGLCVRGQASLWRLYHPERLRSPMIRDANGVFQNAGWEDAFSLIRERVAESRGEGRESVWLSGRTTGTLAGLIGEFCGTMGLRRLPEYEFLSHSALRRAYGDLLQVADLPLYRIEESDFLLTVGADILETFVSPVDFSARLTRARQNPEFRWTHLEPHASLTGFNAHRRLTLRPGSEPLLLSWLLRETAGDRLTEEIRELLPPAGTAEVAAAAGMKEGDMEELGRRFSRASRPLLIVGGTATATSRGLAAAALAALIQERTGMVGQTVDFSRRENYESLGSGLDMMELAGRLDRGEIGVAFFSRTNPVYQLPDSLGFAQKLSRAKLRVGLTDFLDETAREMDVLLPLSHALEGWGDAEPRRGVRTLLRPAVQPLHDTRMEGEILLGLMGEPSDFREYLFAQWNRAYDEKTLQEFSEKGFLQEKVESPPLSADFAAAAALLKSADWAAPKGEGTLLVTPSIRTFDGRSRPIPLLSEVPDPLTTISYGGWVSLGSAAGETLELKDKDEARLVAGEWEGILPVKIQPGLPGGVAVVQRSVLEGAPFAIDPRSGETILFFHGLEVKKTGRKARLAILAGSTSQQGRGIIPDPIHREEHHRSSLYPEHDHPETSWGMAIDLERCIGCGACAASCYLENNVPVTGEENHLKGREMSWLRIEPFYDEEGKPEFIPMLCQQCEYAPCEPVCPVYAAYHNPEGLNVQVYNRCVGTRYCSNNCPYKVRRFNWWTHRRPKPLDRMVNPDLSVRTKGMMEKCTFCIQRIRIAKDRARDESRAVRDGEVTTACAQSCPTGAIVFGNLRDETSQIYSLTRDERAYRVFESLGTEPSVWYLKRRGTEGKDHA